tara:strand:+ start:2215 stop:2493 length:279 start_codon:yes stop_codon:yes gene_type:complete
MEKMHGAEIEISAAQLAQLRVLVHALAAEGGQDLTISYDTEDGDLAADWAILDADLLHRAEEIAARNPDIDFSSDPEILVYARPQFGLSVFV